MSSAQQQRPPCLDLIELILLIIIIPERYRTFSVKLPTANCQRASLKISQHWLRWWPAATSQQPILRATLTHCCVPLYINLHYRPYCRPYYITWEHQACIGINNELCTAALSRYWATGTRFLHEPDLIILLLQIHVHIILKTTSEASLCIVIKRLLFHQHKFSQWPDADKAAGLSQPKDDRV